MPRKADQDSFHIDMGMRIVFYSLIGKELTQIQPDAAPCRNLVLHGTEATGKTSITTTLLSNFSSIPDSPIRHAIVDSTQCITARHIFERIVGAVEDTLDDAGAGKQRGKRCETLAQLTVEMRRLLAFWKDDESGRRRRFVLVLDGVDRQRDAPPTLLPALARLAEMVRSARDASLLSSMLTQTLRSRISRPFSSSPRLRHPFYAHPHPHNISSSLPTRNPNSSASCPSRPLRNPSPERLQQKQTIFGQDFVLLCMMRWFDQQRGRLQLSRELVWHCGRVSRHQSSKGYTKSRSFRSSS